MKAFFTTAADLVRRSRRRSKVEEDTWSARGVLSVNLTTFGELDRGELTRRFLKEIVPSDVGIGGF